MSEYEGKKIELSKQVYSFIRDLRVHEIGLRECIKASIKKTYIHLGTRWFIFALKALKLNEVAAKLQQKSHLGSRYAAQYAKIKFSSKSKASNKTYPGLISMLQGFQKCIA